MSKYYKGIKITKNLCMMVIGHYQDLYDNLEVQSTTEIATIIGVDGDTIRKVLELIYDGPKSDGTFSKRDLMILLCTKFGSSSPYLEDQNREEIQRAIKRRKIVAELKKCKRQMETNKQIETDNKHK